MVFAGIGAAIGIGSSILGGVLGSDADRKDRRLQESYINRGLDALGNARGAINDAEGLALADLDAANVLLGDLEPDILEGLDEQMRVRIGQQIMLDQQEAEAQDQRLAAAGLDSTTAGAGIQRSRKYGQANRLGSLSAAFAGQRSNAILGARTAAAGGLQTRANALANFGAQRANTFSQEASLLGSVQIAPNNVAAGIGAIGGSISNAFQQHAMLQALKGDE